MLAIENDYEEAILLSILQAAKSKKSNILEIMHQALITHTKARLYLDSLVTNRLVDFDVSKKAFKTTAKGERYIAVYNNR